jgi:hypothetical protein
MALFWNLVGTLSQPVIRILDLGGVGGFWKEQGIEDRPHLQVTVVNLEPHPPLCAQVTRVIGDARDCNQWADQSVDVVFSNSLIEHLGSWEEQQAFALSIRRIAKNYFIQTPNYGFPLEPHFMVLGFHYLPVWIRIKLVQHLALGWMPKIPDRAEAMRAIQQIRLLGWRDCQRLFPDAFIWREKFLGLTKSLVAIGGEWRDKVA